MLATAAVLTMLPATAAQFDFYKLKSPVGASDFLPSGPYVNCTSGDKCSSNVDGGVFGGVLSYTDAGISLAASSSFNGGIASVVQDNEDAWSATKGAGLGVYHLKGDNSDDNITTGEKLTITFAQVVTLTRIDLRSEGHNFTSWGAGKTFLLNGASTALPQNLGYLPINMTGTVFTFEFGGQKADQFYLSAMTAQPVPEPGAYALNGCGPGCRGSCRASSSRGLNRQQGATPGRASCAAGCTLPQVRMGPLLRPCFVGRPLVARPGPRPGSRALSTPLSAGASLSDAGHRAACRHCVVEPHVDGSA